jgi:hypothetical protein
VVIPYKFDKVHPFSDGLAKVYISNQGFGIIDKKGNQIVDCRYTEMQAFIEGLAQVQINRAKGYIDKNGNEIIPCGQYEILFGFSEGLMMVNNKNKYGYVDKSGQLIVPCIYANANHFKNGLAWTNKGYIDKNGVTFWED